MNIVCCCAGGKVRSVATKFILEDMYGFKDVLTCGLEKASDELKEMLFSWADVIFIVGEVGLFDKFPTKFLNKVKSLPVGEDVWGFYGHKDLINKLLPMIKEFIREKEKI